MDNITITQISKPDIPLMTLDEVILQNNFNLWGITIPKLSKEDESNIQSFIDKKYYGSMEWFPDRQNIRIDFKNLGFIVQSIIMLGAIYKPPKTSENLMGEWKNKISCYAYGKDYHQVLKKNAIPIIEYLQQNYPGKKFRQAVDSLPIPEKILARNANLGWIGKNTLLLNSEIGSYFFLTAILCEVEPEHLELTIAEKPKIDFNHKSTQVFYPSSSYQELQGHLQKDRCGSCRECMDACPTQAIVSPYQLDASKCISHHTIEYKGDEFEPEMNTHGWVFGCDICQEVCPWNRVKAEKNKVFTSISEFAPISIWKSSIDELKKISDTEFEESFINSPIHRTGLRRLLRNINSVTRSESTKTLIELL